MQISKVEKRINKISSFIEMFKADGKLSKIEKDLLLDYVRKLYDELSSLDVSDVQPKKVQKPIVENTILPVVKEERVKEDKIESQVKHEEKQAEVITKPIVIKEVEKVTPIIDTSVSSKIDKKQIDELFSFDEVKDMSDRLSLSELNDINKAIGINEKIFTIKELFDGDATAYKTTIEALNTTKSIEDARVYLTSNVIEKYGWLNEENSKKAHNFLKIVRRLYV